MLALALLELAGAILPSGGRAIGDAAHWVQAADFPSSERLRAAVTRYDLMVDQTGRPVLCTVTGTSGSSVVDKVACTSLVARARYSPARDAEGNAVPHAIRGKLEWNPDVAGVGNKHVVTADLSVKTALVTPKQGNVPVVVVLIYDQAGAIDRCVVIKRSKFPRLNSDACTAASRPDLFSPVRDGRGATTRGLREIEVEFTHGRKREITAL